MTRLIAFLLAVGCCVFCITDMAGGLVAQENQVSFTQKVEFGDPAALKGRTITGSIHCDDHLWWNTAYVFGEENEYRTEFLFQPEDSDYVYERNRNTFHAFNSGGFGSSTSGSLDVRKDTGYGKMVLDLAAQMGPGERGKATVALADYIQYHGLSYDLNYVTLDRICEEWVRFDDHFVTRLGAGAGQSLEEELAAVQVYSYQVLDELFKFPVQPWEKVDIEVDTNQAGQIRGLNYMMVSYEEGDGFIVYGENDPAMAEQSLTEITLVTAMNDQGVYVIPQFYADWTRQTLLPGEYKYGPGLYFIPWKDVEGEERFYRYDGQESIPRQVVTLDGAGAMNICPMGEDARVEQMKMSEDGKTVWLLSVEDGVYVLIRMDLDTQTVTHRMELMRQKEERVTNTYWYDFEDKMLIQAEEELALIVGGNDPEVEFLIGIEEIFWGFNRFEPTTGAIWYDGDKLIVADRWGYYEASLTVVAFDKTGPLYWGEYESSLARCNDPWYSPGVLNSDIGITIE